MKKKQIKTNSKANKKGNSNQITPHNDDDELPTDEAIKTIEPPKHPMKSE